VITITYELSSEELSDIFEGTLEETIEIRIPACSPNCTASEIDEALGPANSIDGKWVGVLVGNTLYFHSGWNTIQGPWPGDIFRRAIKYDSEVILCLEGECYRMKAYIQLGGDQVSESIYLSDLFTDIEEKDLFIITCDYGFVLGSGSSSPKIIAQLRPIQN
jgi:hypothetical protein